MEWTPLLYAFGFLALGLALLIAEFFVVSFGVLLVGAIASAAAAIYFAFSAGDLAGWSFVALVPLAAAGVTRWGIQRVQRSHVVPQAEITADAGYHHVAERVGVQPGSLGEMVTPAHPSGRARFSGGECDVQSRAGALERGAGIRVVAIDGPIIFVEPDVAVQNE